jgi:hypothetical protein
MEAISGRDRIPTFQGFIREDITYDQYRDALEQGGVRSGTQDVQ